MKPAYQYGVTLIELLIVVVIIAILASIALPGYHGYTVKSRRDDARQLLMLNAQRLQRCFTLEGVYNGSCSMRSNSESGYYTVTSGTDDITTNTFMLIASPVIGMSQENDSECMAFTYENTGKRSSTGTDPNSCW